MLTQYKACNNETKKYAPSLCSHCRNYFIAVQPRHAFVRIICKCNASASDISMHNNFVMGVCLMMYALA